jgi:HSP20 family molecular chaperone IbpA
MSHVSRERRRGVSRRPRKAGGVAGSEFTVTKFKKPREWRYQTRPVFKRVMGPLVDVFDEAEEVLIVVDLGGFTRGDITIRMTPRHYILQAARGAQHFEERIDLPANVDLEHVEERLLNGVLEIILPRRNVSASTRSPRLPVRKARS